MFIDLKANIVVADFVYAKLKNLLHWIMHEVFNTWIKGSYFSCWTHLLLEYGYVLCKLKNFHCFSFWFLQWAFPTPSKGLFDVLESFLTEIDTFLSWASKKNYMWFHYIFIVIILSYLNINCISQRSSKLAHNLWIKHNYLSSCHMHRIACILFWDGAIT
jgi:hypothetical protein